MGLKEYLKEMRMKAEMKKDLEKAGKYKKPKLGQQIIAEGLMKGYKKGVTAYKPGVKEKRFTKIARKAISLAAPSGSLVKAITKPSEKSRGRGRPRGTYKARYLPSGKVVKVPTHIYKKMLSAEKAQLRLMRVQRQMEAEQLAMQQDPRFQPGAEEQFLAEPDQLHEAEVMRLQQEAELAQRGGVPQRPGIPRKIVKGVGVFGRGVSRLGEDSQPRMVDQFGKPVQLQAPPRVPVVDMRPREPRVTAVSGKANLLNISGKSNTPNQSLTPWNKRRLF